VAYETSDSLTASAAKIHLLHQFATSSPGPQQVVGAVPSDCQASIDIRKMTRMT
jgi:hypothetical protein